MLVFSTDIQHDIQHARSELHFGCYFPQRRDCCLTMPVIKGRCARDALPHTFNIGVFKSIKKNSTTTKLIYDKSANIVEGYNIAFDTHDCGNFHTMPLTGIESMVTFARLRYTEVYLMPGVCSLIRTAAIENSMPFPTKIHSHVIISSHNMCTRLCCTLFDRVNIDCGWRIQIGHIHMSQIMEMRPSCYLFFLLNSQVTGQ